jgi:hypothetical protein
MKNSPVTKPEWQEISLILFQGPRFELCDMILVMSLKLRFNVSIWRMFHKNRFISNYILWPIYQDTFGLAVAENWAKPRVFIEQNRDYIELRMNSEPTKFTSEVRIEPRDVSTLRLAERHWFKFETWLRLRRYHVTHPFIVILEFSSRSVLVSSFVWQSLFFSLLP